MPKRGGNGGGRSRRNNDGERPQNRSGDRDSFGDGSGGGGGGGGRNQYHYNNDRKSLHRVSFKLNSGGVGKPWKTAIKKLVDDDIDMSDQAIISGGRNRQGFRGGFRGGRGRKDGSRVNSPAPRQNYHQSRKLMPGLSPWYQVMIPYGNQHEKTFLLKAILTSISPDVFIPYYYSVVGNTAIFYVDDFEIAEKLYNTDRKISMPNGYRLAIKVKSGTPQISVDSGLMEKMKLAMANRYNPATRALDLTKFHSDPALIDSFCPLFRPTIMLAALNLIADNIPDLEALNLNENKLQTIDKNIAMKLPRLKILYLARNKILHINLLEPLKELPIMDLYLEGNPLVDRFKEKEIYIREVRKKCTKLLKLDGVELPPVIGFDVSDEKNIPASQPSFLCNVEGQGIVKQFLEQFFALYDSDSRQPLLDAYHENAMFSMATYYSQNTTGNRLNQYMSNSRNFIRVTERDTRRRHLKTGRLQVVSFLNDLPKTQHCPNSLTVDLTMYTPTMLMLTINGLFKEIDQEGSSRSNSPPIRAFHKTMIIVPYGAGFCIQNDILTITNATAAQVNKFFTEPAEPVTVLPIAAPPPAYPTMPVNSPQAAATSVPTQDMRQQLVQTIAMQTNMNLEWSTNCLEQTNWDLSRALLVFTQLHKQGSIPPEAFIK